jgi:hypothetical protein
MVKPQASSIFEEGWGHGLIVSYVPLFLSPATPETKIRSLLVDLELRTVPGT